MSFPTEGPEPYKFIDLEITDGSINIEGRAPYCDRGRFMVRIFSRSMDLYIDAADIFPRYFFHWDCLIKEMETWMKARNQTFI